MALIELKRFLYVTPDHDLPNAAISKDVLLHVDTLISKLVEEKKGANIIDELIEYSNKFHKYSHVNRSAKNVNKLMFVLASCSKSKLDDVSYEKNLSNLGFILHHIFV
jgi:hypothetical protein